MSDGKLVFSRPVSGSGRLVFGAGGGGGTVTPDAQLSVNAGFVGEGGAGVQLAVAVQAQVDAGFAEEGASALSLRWDANAPRTTAAYRRQHQQQGCSTTSAARAHWQRSQPLHAAHRPAWQDGAPALHVVRTHWQRSQALAPGVRSGWQQAQGLAAATRVHLQQALALRAAGRASWQQGTLLLSGWQMGFEQVIALRAGARSHMQVAQPVAQWARGWLRAGLPLAHAWRAQFQRARYPLPGITPGLPPPQPPREPCYDPARLGLLVFEDRAAGDGRLVFVCRRGGTQPPPAAVVVPARRSYIVINSIEIRRADDLASDPLPSESFQMQLDRQSWTWTFSAAFHASARDAIAPGPGGQPVELEVRVNGQPFRLQAERIGRSRRFPEHLVTASGRGLAAVLDAPHAPVQTFSHEQDRTAQQLMTDVLTVGGVGFGWAVDFQLADWLVPGGVWMHQGTWISALADIAGAVGGYLQPHDTAPVLRVLPLWPQPWWHWGTLAPDIELPDGIAEITETEVIDLPAYDRMIFMGEAGGIQADLTREGLPGHVLKQPMAVHPLITTIGAAKQRAIAELAESGRMLKHKMTLPVLPATGVIKPGAMLRYVDDAQTLRMGIVRGTTLNQQFPVLTQSLEIDSHA